MAYCDDSIAKTFEAYVSGRTFKVKLEDIQEEIQIDYMSSDDYMNGYLDEGNPVAQACATIEAKFLEHAKSCSFCQANLPFGV